MRNIPMVDLKGQYARIKPEIDEAIQAVLDSAYFIKGPQVKSFEDNLAAYLNVKHVIGCANGTDALQVALMSLNLEAGDEVIVPSFTYVATAEVIALLGLTPVMIDVDPVSFNVTSELIAEAITSRTKVIVPVHLFGQCCDMEPIMTLAAQHSLYVIEDNAQAIGADYTLSTGKLAKAGTQGHIGCTSFFPSKNLGCYGDGGAIFTNDDQLASTIRMIANHGQRIKYHHDLIGCNSRLDTIQAAVLDVKLTHLDDFGKARADAASYYTQELAEVDGLTTPHLSSFSTHVFHQYTMRIHHSRRNQLQAHLKEAGIANAIYYPVPLYKQLAYQTDANKDLHLDQTELLCAEVLSIPIHTEMNHDIQDYVIKTIKAFFLQ